MHVEDEISHALRASAKQYEPSDEIRARIRANIDARIETELLSSPITVTAVKKNQRGNTSWKDRRKHALIAIASVAAVSAIFLGAQSRVTPAEASWYNGVALSATQASTHHQQCIDRGYMSWNQPWPGGPTKPEDAASALESARVVFAENRGETAALVLETSQGAGFICVVPQPATNNAAYSLWTSFGLDFPVHFGTETFKDNKEGLAGAEVWFDRTDKEFVRYETTLQSGKVITGTVQNGYYYVVDVYTYTLGDEPSDNNGFTFTDRDASLELTNALFEPRSTRFYRADNSGVTITYGASSQEESRQEF